MIAATLGSEEAWLALADVADPEMPAISIVDLGIVRAIAVDGDRCRVTLTPTYSGCPAFDVIEGAVREALHAIGFLQVVVQRVLAPAWSSDWLSAAGRANLARDGIAPSHRVAMLETRAGRAVACPRCKSQRTGVLAQFGATSCKALYRCLDCLEPFDYFKPH